MPKMILDLNIVDDIKNAIEEKLKAKKLLIEGYILELIRNDIKTTISFNGYSYNFLYDKFYCEKEEIILTKIEKRLLRFLLNNVNNIVSIEEIQTNVWQNKNMSLFKNIFGSFINNFCVKYSLFNILSFEIIW